MERIIHLKKSNALLIAVISIMVINTLLPLRVFALDTSFYISNDILFYNPEATNCSGSGSASYGTAPKTANLKSFVDTYGQGAFDVGKKYGIPYEAILAQGMLESYYGKSELAYKYYNFFGIKAGSDWNGKTVSMGTSEEYTKGVSTKITASFRAYPSIEAGWEGYALFITNNGNPKRYKSALKYPGDYVRYIQEIKKDGYATSSDYVKNTVKLANTVADYIKSNNKWPPSSEVAKTNTPTGSTSSNTTTTTSSCNDSTVSSITSTALKFALDKPAKSGQNSESDAKPAYVEAIKTYNPGANVADCGMFVGTVMIASGADKSYPKSGTSIQLDYVKSHTDKYKIITSPKKTDLEPGDILIVNNGVAYHTMIYTGNTPYPAVDASQDDRVPSVRPDSSLSYMLGRSGVIAARLINE